jgi:hypothetical protein
LFTPFSASALHIAGVSPPQENVGTKKAARSCGSTTQRAGWQAFRVENSGILLHPSPQCCILPLASRAVNALDKCGATGRDRHAHDTGNNADPMANAREKPPQNDGSLLEETIRAVWGMEINESRHYVKG